MSDTTKIQWCDDNWRPCRIEAGQLVRAATQKRLAPLRWAKKPWVCDGCGHCQHGDCDAAILRCEECGDFVHRRRVFPLSIVDWLDGPPGRWKCGECGETEPQAGWCGKCRTHGDPWTPIGGVPTEWLAEMLDVIRQTPQLDYLLLTKRPENFDGRILDAQLWLIDHCKSVAPHSRAHDMAATAAWLAYWRPGEHVPNNVWMGASVEDQKRADERIPALLRIPAAKHWLSLDPLLCPVDLKLSMTEEEDAELGYKPRCESIDWLVIGGESGPEARPCNVDWIRDLLRQASESGLPAFVKQLGAFSTVGPCQPDGRLSYSRTNTHHPKGGDPAEWPEDLRVRQWPGRKA